MTPVTHPNPKCIETVGDTVLTIVPILLASNTAGRKNDADNPAIIRETPAGNRTKPAIGARPLRQIMYRPPRRLNAGKEPDKDKHPRGRKE